MKVVFCLETINVSDFLLLPGVGELLTDFQQAGIPWAYWLVKDGHLFSEIISSEAANSISRPGGQDSWKQDRTDPTAKGISQGEAMQLMRKKAEDTLAVTDSLELASQLQAAHVCCIGYQNCEDTALFPGADLVLLSFDGLDSAFFTAIHRRHLGLPVVIAETDRVVLRESCEEDFPALYRISRETGNDAYTETMGGNEEEEREKFLAYIRHVYGFCGFGLWTVIKKDTHDIIGRCGISLLDGNLDSNKGNMRPHMELGYLISQKFRRQGYAGEACGKILQYAFDMLEVPEIYAVIHRDNRPSRYLARKLGFRNQGPSGRKLEVELWRLQRTEYEEAAALRC